MTSRTNLQNQQYNINTQKHSNTNLLQSNTEEANKAQNEKIIIITNLLTHQSSLTCNNNLRFCVCGATCEVLPVFIYLLTTSATNE